MHEDDGVVWDETQHKYVYADTSGLGEGGLPPDYCPDCGVHWSEEHYPWCLA